MEMTERVLGPTGSRRRRRTILFVLLGALAALVLAMTGSATNTTLNAFEIEGDLTAATSNGTSEDWVNTANTGADSASAALKCTVGSCTPANVTDGSGVGTGELFRDDLKVDPDRTTFTQGDKENDYDSGSVTCPTGQPCVSSSPYHIVTGTTPPNKDDLFDVVSNSRISGTQAELDLGMVRTNNNGSSHVDFELNRVDWTPGSTTGATCGKDTTTITGFKCPVRTEGDLLISFEISPSSTTPPVEVNTRYFVWDLPGGTDANGHGRGSNDCQGPLTGNENTCPWEEIAAPSGSVLLFGVNGADLAAAPWGSRLPDGTATSTYPAGGWFEAGIDLDALGFSPSCPGFGTASAKARSSGSSVTSALTDLAGPFPVNLNNCAKITIIKDAQPNSAQDFTYTTTGTGLSSFSLDDDSDATLSTTKVFSDLSPGAFSVTEGAPGGGYALSTDTCVVDKSDASDPTTASGNNSTGVSTINLGNTGEVTCTYVNVLQRSLIISKVAKDASTTTTGAEPLGGVTFVITPSPATGSGTLSVTDLFAGEASGTDQFRSSTTGKGKICVDLGSTVSTTSFSIAETVPTGYAVVAPNPKTSIAPTSGTCASRGASATADAAFVNDPLSTITVGFSSQATGASGAATAANINCSPAGTTTEQGSADPAFDDTSESFADLKPGQVICTINIDP
jgi:hypothetical protein